MAYLPGLVKGESGEIFMFFFKQPLKDFFSSIVPKPACRALCDFVLNYMICDFSNALRWRTANRHFSPEEISDFFFETTPAAGA